MTEPGRQGTMLEDALGAGNALLVSREAEENRLYRGR
jgi:hypothetical protein